MSRHEKIHDAQFPASGMDKPVFPFPGGRRFHFSDSRGNDFAVWSDLAEFAD